MCEPCIHCFHAYHVESVFNLIGTEMSSSTSFDNYNKQSRCLAWSSLCVGLCSKTTYIDHTYFFADLWSIYGAINFETQSCISRKPSTCKAPQEEILLELRELQRSSQKAGAAHARVRAEGFSGRRVWCMHIGTDILLLVM